MLVKLRQELRALRIRAGLTQEKLADLVGMDRMTVVRWENGKSPIDTRTEIAIRAVIAEWVKQKAKKE